MNWVALYSSIKPGTGDPPAEPVLWIWVEPEKKKLGKKVRLPSVPTVQLMPVLQQDHSQYLRFKRMI